MGNFISGIVDTGKGMIDSTLGTDLTGQKKKARRDKEKLEKTLLEQQEEDKKKEQKEKEKQRQNYKNFYETSRYNSLGLLKEKDKQVIG